LYLAGAMITLQMSDLAGILCTFRFLTDGISRPIYTMERMTNRTLF
jgi:hypothetical protein